MNPYEDATYPLGDPHAPDTADETMQCRSCGHEQPERFEKFTYCENCSLLMSDGVPNFGSDE